ncbi:MAG: hypothetical protein H6670_01775 [Anaerolineaceae bacterium]|nr:hypothetical protein [Anaerolineaceae bacterium]
MTETKRFLLCASAYFVSATMSFFALGLCSRFVFTYIIRDDQLPRIAIGFLLMVIFSVLSAFIIGPIMTYIAMIWYDRHIGYKQKRKKPPIPVEE